MGGEGPVVRGEEGAWGYILVLWPEQRLRFFFIKGNCINK